MKRRLLAFVFESLAIILTFALICASARLGIEWGVMWFPITCAISLGVGFRIWKAAENYAHPPIQAVRITKEELSANPELAAALYILHHHLHHIRNKSKN